MAKTKWWDKTNLISQVGVVGEEVVIQHFQGDDEDDPCLKVAKTWTTPDDVAVFIKNQPTITLEYCLENPTAPEVLLAFSVQVAEMMMIDASELIWRVIEHLGLDFQEAEEALSTAHQLCEDELEE